MPDRPNPLLHSMVLFWDQIEQALDIVKPHQIVEIGSEGGGNTKLLCDWVTQHDAKLISVDPAFSEAARQLAQQCSQIELVERPSPWGLEGIAGGGAWLIDGDHNYWTVKAELEHAFSTSEPTLAILHDIGWPAGRRDQYYSPGLLPPEAVHPHSFELGVTPWDETSVPGGFRGGGAFAYALREGGDRNGVLTAIEDFAEQRGGLRLVKIPSVFGIGFLFPQDAVWADELSSALSNLERLELLKTLEENRLQLFLMVLELQDRESSVLESARSALSDASAQMAALAAENATIKKQLTHGEAAWPSIGPLTVDPKLGDSQRARRPRVLCYSPYTWIPVHGWWEMTVAKGLLLRGADLSYVVCDGLYSDCDLFWEATNPRPPHACTICQAAVTQRALEMELKLMWLGRYLISEEWEKAKRWAESLSASELFEASYADWPVAEWVTSSVRSHLRRGYPDRSDPHVQAVMRSYLFSGLIACFAIDRLLRETDPDVLLVTNGRQSSTRVALELGRAHGIRVITQEAAPSSDMITLLENETAISVAPLKAYWSQWHDVPLSRHELGVVLQYLVDRQYGRDKGKPVYTNAPQSAAKVSAALGLNPSRPVWALFTSSDDEVIGSRDLDTPFQSQSEWVRHTVDYARRHPEIDLVLRIHPNTSSRRSYGHNREQAAEFSRLKAELPANVVMVDPESELSSYSLMDLAAVGLVWASTAGLELSCKGKAVLTAADSYVSNTSFAHTLRLGDDYDAMLDRLLAVRPLAVDPEIARSALRHAYGVFFRMRIPFPLVTSPFPGQGTPTYDSFDALLEGRDAGLDRACRIVLDGEPEWLPPTAEHLARSCEAEDEALARAFGLKTSVFAYADELVADPSLLEGWATAARGRAGVRLLVQSEPDQYADLIRAAELAGLLDDGSPEVVAGSFTSTPPVHEPGVDQMVRPVAVLSHRLHREDSFSELPVYDDASDLLESVAMAAPVASGEKVAG